VRRPENLKAALQEINRRPVGCDGIRYEAFTEPLAYSRWHPEVIFEFGSNFEPVKYLQERIACQEMADPTMEVIAKRGRAVQSSTVADRIIQRAIARKLDRSFDPLFPDSSWGYRPERSAQGAIWEVRRQIRAGAHWAFKTDIEHFFDNVNRGILSQQLAVLISDQKLRDFMMAMISPMVLSKRGAFVQTGALPQGNGITPFLANIYVLGLDFACSGFNYFRYVDDLLVLGRTRGEVVAAQSVIIRELSCLGLKLNACKTFIRDLHQQPVIYLGYEIRGGNLYPPANAVARFRQTLGTRGCQARANLMVSFVRRFRFTRARKLFRRLDRQLAHLYPDRLTLVALFDAARVTHVGHGLQTTLHLEELRVSYGNAASMVPEKALTGRPPRSPRLGAAALPDSLSPAPRRTHMVPTRSSKYLQFIRTRACSLCADPETDAHHSLRTLPGISEAGLAQKGSDYLAIPLCRRHHELLHSGRETLSREEILELIVINLICYVTRPRSSGMDLSSSPSTSGESDISMDATTAV
jgi:hypothetical protein